MKCNLFARLESYSKALVGLGAQQRPSKRPRKAQVRIRKTQQHYRCSIVVVLSHISYLKAIKR